MNRRMIDIIRVTEITEEILEQTGNPSAKYTFWRVRRHEQ